MIKSKYYKSLKWKALFILFCSVFLNCNNFHEVSHGTLYRSRQLNATQFDKYIHKYGIKTVINLRGPSPSDTWYKEEIIAMKNNGTQHIDIDLTATKYVAPQVLDSIVALASSAPKPILVHCKAGADRTGLFCAVWRYKIDHLQPQIASKQLSILYGHFPFFIWSQTEAMDKSFRDYVRMHEDLTK